MKNKFTQKWKKFKLYFFKWKLVNIFKYRIIPFNKRCFILSELEEKNSEKIRKEKGDISYEFYPTSIGYAVYVKVMKTGEIINITDYGSW